MAIERRRPRWELAQWRPFWELEDWERRMDQTFGRPIWQTPFEEKGWMPAVDVYEKNDRYIVKADLPGIKEEDIDISISGDNLAIKGEKKAETEVKEENYYRSERTYGSFYRSIQLPSDVDAEKIKANFENGVLEVTLPKSAETKPRKITLSTGKKSAPRK